MSGNIKSSDLHSEMGTQPSYQPQDRIAVQPRMPFNPYAGLGQASYLQAFPASAGSAGWRKPRRRWREYGILLGLWLLVLLAAGVIGIRVLDLDAGPAKPDNYGRVSATPATPARPPALAPSKLAADDDPFDDPVPALPPVAAATPATIATPTATTAAALRASNDMADTRGQQPAAVASALALAPNASARRPASEAWMPASAAPRTPAACPPALSAMQLCGEEDR
jgi:hypothetical protein